MTVRKALTVALVLLALLIVALEASAARHGNKQLWGAIAYSSKTGSYGYAVDMRTKRDAETEAFRQCGSNCDLIRTFRDACGAVAVKPKRVIWETGASREIAETKALRKCGESCAIKVWACTSEK
jgi:serine/threonine-protein kinase